ncbi:SANT domain-containing protein [Psidium guajava]|nr:SANT domain-containing protein [Psidium guajava]
MIKNMQSAFQPVNKNREDLLGNFIRSILVKSYK